MWLHFLKETPESFIGMKKSVVTAFIFQITGLRIHLHQQGNGSNVTHTHGYCLSSSNITSSPSASPSFWCCWKPAQVKSRKCLLSYQSHESPFIWLQWVPSLGNLTPKRTRLRKGFRTEGSTFYTWAHLWWLQMFLKAYPEDPTLII